MSVTGNQQQIYLRLAAELRPHWRRDAAFAQRLHTLIARQRAFGSRDRRLYRELLYTTVRYAPWIEPRLDRDPVEAAATVAWLSADIPATHVYRHTHSTDRPPCPGPVAAKAAILHESAEALLPAWLKEECPQAWSLPELDALHRRAPLWLRVQSEDHAAIAAEFAASGWTWRSSVLRPEAWEVLSEADVTRSQVFERGLFEIQDLGSQLILATADIPTGGRWLDACAGAGGKTLQLAQRVGPEGRIDAHDIRPAALAELATRARRAGLRNISVRQTEPAGIYDGVLVDAPCSGSGTWRRSPHLKWTTTPGQIARHAAEQLALLRHFSAHVRPGGQLIYATCSLARSENTKVMETFLTQQLEFSPLPPATDFGYTPDGFGLAIMPAAHDTDGFYVATLRRR
jgi:16S rRNA (cytosine967-C5)-methyltransferase